MRNRLVERLSQAALETLSIIAYKQPISRIELMKFVAYRLLALSKSWLPVS